MSMQMIEIAETEGITRILPGVKPPSNQVIDSLSAQDQVLLTKLLTEPAEFIGHPAFADPDIETKLFGGPSN